MKMEAEKKDWEQRCRKLMQSIATNSKVNNDSFLCCNVGFLFCIFASKCTTRSLAVRISLLWFLSSPSKNKVMR